jgi:phage tail tube protein FII
MIDQSALAELFSRDPVKCTDQDIAALVAAYRDRRKQFDLGNMKARSSKPATGKAAAITKAINVTLDL